MKITLLKHNEIDKKKWDEVINKSTSPKIYALSWYLDITSPNWLALVSDNYEFVFPIPIKRMFRIISYAPTPRFTQQLGLFSQEKITIDILNAFISKVPKKFVRKEFLLNSSNPIIKENYERSNFILKLDDYKLVKDGFSTQNKRNKKLADKFELDFRKKENHQNIIHLFETSKGKEIEKIDYSILDDICLTSRDKDKLNCYSIYEKDMLISGAITLTHLDRIYLILLANHPKSRENGASTALINFIIKENCNSDFILDFEGSNIPSLARFYKGFGSINEPYQLYSKRLF